MELSYFPSQIAAKYESLVLNFSGIIFEMSQAKTRFILLLVFGNVFLTSVLQFLEFLSP
ncbi:MAG: hypothetical protein ACI8PB_005056 [Desulforhopalus sp.]|jgi:hypothetical protein